MFYYLEKFCRICIQTGGKLTDIETKDHDSVKFSDKLKACTQMVIARESLSTLICSSCVHKLRISYQFQNMCKKSTELLQEYLTELLSGSDEITAEKFFNSELTITTASPSAIKPRRKRVGKDERCSLLKKLLSRITEQQIVHNIHINGLSKLCDKIPLVMIDQPSTSINNDVNDNLRKLKKPKEKDNACGLRDLLQFTRNFDFGYDISVNNNCNDDNFDLTPLERLTRFTQTFFYDHFIDYRETILHVEDNLESDSSDDESMFEAATETEFIKEEIVIVEPDLTFKKELYYDENDDEDDDDEDDDDRGAMCNYDFTSRFVQACYEDEQDSKYQTIKKENIISEHATEIIPLPSTSSVYSPISNYDASQSSYYPNYYHLKGLDEAQVQLRRHRTLSPYSIKCRTRGNPFINPQLKSQFQMRNFKCSTCSRRFKSPGYLKAHCSKLKH